MRITLRSANIKFSACQKNGQDVRVTAADGTSQLPYWIEMWNPASDSAVIWVKVPRILAGAATTLYIYFGNRTAEDGSSGVTTFDFFEDFETAYSTGTGWTPKRPLPFERVADCAGAVYDNKLYVFGGYDRNAPADCNLIFSDLNAIYDPATDTWVRKAKMPTPRWGVTAVECNGLIHVFGGDTEGRTKGAVHEVYDPRTDTWSQRPNGPKRLDSQGGMGVQLNGKIHLFLSKAHFEYDPATDKYTEKAQVPTPRKWATCAIVNGLIYLIGGSSPGFPRGFTDVNEVYNPATDTWTTRAPLPVARYGMTRENPVIDGKIFVSHGQSAGFFAEVFCYDPSTDKWEKRSSGINPRDGIASGVINGKLYVVGGRSVLDCVPGMNQLEEYDPCKDRLESPNPWTCDNVTIIRRDTSAHYQGSWGLLLDKLAMVGEVGIQTSLATGSCAVDFFWKMTGSYVSGSSSPWGTASLGRHLSDGSLMLVGDGGQPRFIWFDGTDSVLQKASYNTWYAVTLTRYGNKSTVSIGARTHTVPTSSAPSRVYFGVNQQTRDYIDVVRVRKYVSPEPSVTIGTGPPERNGRL